MTFIQETCVTLETYYKVTKTNNIMAIDNITFPRLEEGSETLL
jgi:hypothetical protein